MEPQRPARVMWVDSEPMEITIQDLIQKIPAGDVVVINDTKVLKRRIFFEDLEILFLNQKTPLLWEVLFPSKKYSIEDTINLPQGVKMTLKGKGRPQLVELSRHVAEDYFQQVAELPLPPYIQKNRRDRHAQVADLDWYQSAWAEKSGSLAAPTASLHFSKRDMISLQERGVKVFPLTLHVGLGTFLPVTTENLDDHPMHEEWVEIPQATWLQVQKATSEGRQVWALGTTVARSLESAALNLLPKNKMGDLSGFTRILIQPGFRWQVVTRLLTNFHQPESTLLALVAGFSDLKKVKWCYAWAVENKFRLFSYGDLTVWIK